MRAESQDDYHDRARCPICKDRNALSIRMIATKQGLSRGKVQKHFVRWGGKARPEVKRNGKEMYWEARDAGLDLDAAARFASVSLHYASNLEGMHRASKIERPRASLTDINPDNDARHVAALIAAGGYARLSEKPTRTGPVVCLPLIQFGAVR